MNVSNDNQCEITTQKRIAIAIASWLCGMLEGAKESTDDEKIIEALDAWLNIQMTKYDKIFIGLMKCKNCSHQWNTVVFSRNSKMEKCPQCGSTEASVIFSENDTFNNDDITKKLNNLHKHGQSLADELNKLKDIMDSSGA